MKTKLLPITVTFLFLIFFLVFFLGLKNPNTYKPNINEKKETFAETSVKELDALWDESKKLS